MTALRTQLVHPPRIAGEPAGAISTPIYQTATFATGPGAPYDYSRSGNPTRDVLEAQLALLDGATRALAWASGVSAIDAVLNLVDAGAEVVVGDDLYGGTARLLDLHRSARGLELRLVDASDVGAVTGAVTSRTRLVLVESVTNPRLQRVEVAALAAATRGRALLAVDNTMLSSYIERPLLAGADIAIQSATKLLGGHSDLTAGVVATNDASLAARLQHDQNARGTALAPFDSWLLLRGLATLPVRVDRQRATTLAVAEWLRSRAPLTLCGEQAGVVLSFTTGSLPMSRTLLEATRLFHTAVSFGGVASSISLPWSMSHQSIPADQRAARAFPADLVRLSIGLEEPADLIADLEQAFARAAARCRRECAPDPSRRLAAETSGA